MKKASFVDGSHGGGGGTSSDKNGKRMRGWSSGQSLPIQNVVEKHPRVLYNASNNPQMSLQMISRYPFKQSRVYSRVSV